ncbi:aminopeptidase [Conexibacter sp. DBS9H8]|uniref:aminopeptidase n=1 Tax=Conexibacter sp. DBS9H8 TaxID=2937801 RepID=UPI00200E0E07|nr:aminopeptidase [Conexibacter sp. DBS9H8]
MSESRNGGGRVELVSSLSDLIVSDVGVNVQAGQIVGITAAPGMEAVWRAVAEAAYRRGASYVDLWVFDGHVKHSRLTHAPLHSLAYRPPWWGERYRSLGALAGAQIRLAGEPALGLMEDIAPERLGIDMMPRLPETLEVTHARQWNWIVTPGPCAGWAARLYPDLTEAAALDRLWEEIADIMRLGEPDPAAAWRERFAQLDAVARRLTALKLDALHFQGPGTDLRVGLLPGSLWQSAGDETAGGIPFTANLPTEEVFTAPDPVRVDGHVRATRPLTVGGGTVVDLEVHFLEGRAVEVSARQGAGLVEAMIATDPGAARLGEVALVDAESRIGRLGTVFSETLLDENAASHIALGAAYPDTVSDAGSRAQINESSIHIDFMIGSPEISVTGLTADGGQLPLLRDGRWQFAV